MRKVGTNNIFYDKNKLKAAIAGKGMSASALSKQMGFSETYIADCNRHGSGMKPVGYKLMCMILGVDESALLPDPPEPETADKPDESENLNKAMADMAKFIKHEIDRINERIDGIENDIKQCRTNTQTLKVQTEKVKETVLDAKLDLQDSLQDIAETLTFITDVSGADKLIKAKALLSDVLKTGSEDENKILLEAQKAGVPKKYLDRAKSEMGVLVETKGYGKNQSKRWFFG